MKYFYLAILPVLFLSCGGAPMVGSFLPQRDRNPPTLLDYRISCEEGLILVFDEPSYLIESSLLFEPPLSLSAASGGSEKEIIFTFEEPGLPGKAYKIHFDARDEKGNQNWFIVEFYSPNPRLPRVVINELSPKGSSLRPDMVELYVLESGNTAGMTFFTGIEERGYPSWTFAEMEWQAGEYILLHCRPEGLAEEISEEGEDFDLSGGLRSEPGIRDLWAPEDMNLSGTSGMLSLMGSPEKGPHMDRIIYTNRLNNTDDKYGGWTSSFWTQISALICIESPRTGWLWNGESLMPGHAVWSGDTTSTRTLCRDSDSYDSDKASDWHTVPTGGSSFGYINDNSLYE